MTSICTAAGGWGALHATARALREQSALAEGGRSLLSMNQPDGFDCPGCCTPRFCRCATSLPVGVYQGLLRLHASGIDHGAAIGPAMTWLALRSLDGSCSDHKGIGSGEDVTITPGCDGNPILRQVTDIASSQRERGRFDLIPPTSAVCPPLGGYVELCFQRKLVEDRVKEPSRERRCVRSTSELGITARHFTDIAKRHARFPL
jgi:hypothetical protein